MQHFEVRKCQTEKNIKPILAAFFILATVASCKKDNDKPSCFAGIPTARTIQNKKATVQLTATVNPVYLVEEGTIDTRLIPCNFPMEFYQDGLEVTINGEVKATNQIAAAPCCLENFVITKIER